MTMFEMTLYPTATPSGNESHKVDERLFARIEIRLCPLVKTNS